VSADGRALWEYPHEPWEYGWSGSCAVTAGGRRVWVTVPSSEGDLWVLLDGESGVEIGRMPLLTQAVGSVATLHPDGKGFLTVGANDDVLRFHRFADSAVDCVFGWSAVPGKGPDDDDSTVYWDNCGGYLDAATALVATYHDAEDEDEPCRHWLLDPATRAIRGPIAYPRGSDPAGIRSLGDGTWVTGSAGGGLVRWSLSG
jgi:hypothetical protein